MSSVDIKIHKRFIDGNKLYGPGTYSVAPSDARRLHAQGKGRIVDSAIADGIDNAIIAQGGVIHDEPKGMSLADQVRENDLKKTSDKSNDLGLQGGHGASELPDDFPERDTLIANGLGSVEALSQKDIEDKLGAIDGIGKGTINKIALALNKLKKG